MVCPKCNQKCKIVQTHNTTEAVVEKCILPPDPQHPYEVNVGEKIVNRPIIRRKHRCPNCKIYFWTVERFSGYTEATLRNATLDKIKERMDSTDFDDTDCVFCIPPEKKEVRIKLNIPRKD